MTATDWRLTECARCGGYGVIAAYSGGEFDGAADCPSCLGLGVLSVSPQDRLADYPGGPFRGRRPGAYAAAREEGAGSCHPDSGLTGC